MSLFRCYRCLYPNTRPDIHFNDEGLCSACQAYDARKLIDWDKRKDEFLTLVNDHRGKSHDVIVACSGGKDSTWQVVKCLELGLRPLAVTATTDHLSKLGRKNLDNISNLCDHIEITPHKPTRNKISKFALQEVGDISWCEHHLIWSVPAREALQRGIPIVLYGECPQNEYGAGPAGSETQTQLTHDWVHEFGGLLGLRLSDVAEILEIEPRHLELYKHPNDPSVQSIFMGSYFEWDGWENYKVAKSNGFRGYARNIENSYANYENLDNIQTGIHDRLRWLKFGFSRACDIVSSHIRRGRISRADGAAVVSEIEHNQVDSYLGEPYRLILKNIGITEGEFQDICQRFTNKQVVEWVLNKGSYQSFYGTTTEPSKESNSVKAAA